MSATLGRKGILLRSDIPTTQGVTGWHNGAHSSRRCAWTSSCHHFVVVLLTCTCQSVVTPFILHGHVGVLVQEKADGGKRGPRRMPS